MAALRGDPQRGNGNVSDALGALSLPVAAPTVSSFTDGTRAPGDPALVTLGSFAATVLQTDVGTAWETLSPGKPDQVSSVDGERLGTGPVRRVWHSNPRDGQFSPEDLPGLFAYRTGAAVPQRFGADLYRRRWAVALTWIFPPADQQAQRRERDPFLNAVSASLHRAFVHLRHPAWILPGDAADADGLVATAVQTSLSAVTLSGAQLTGALAGLTATPGRPVQISTSVAAGAYNTTLPLRFTGILDSGVVHTDSVYLTAANGGETLVGTWSFRPVTQIYIPAQALTTGAFTFGFYASPHVKLGSLVQRACGFVECKLRSASAQPIPVRMPVGDPVLFRGYELVLDVAEDLASDPAEHAELYDPDVAAGLDASFYQGNNDPFNSFSL